MGPARRFCTPGLSGGISRRTGISKSSDLSLHNFILEELRFRAVVESSKDVGRVCEGWEPQSLFVLTAEQSTTVGRVLLCVLYSAMIAVSKLKLMTAQKWAHILRTG